VEAPPAPSRQHVVCKRGSCVVPKYVDSNFNKELSIMDLEKNQPCRKKNGKNCSFEFKTFVIEQINNGQISLNFASKKYNVSRSTLEYWRKKLSNYTTKNNAMSLEQENKKLRERIEELEFVKDFQQDLIANFEKVTGQELSKKFLPEQLSNEIQRKKKRLSK
jgi:transposase-like protein